MWGGAHGLWRTMAMVRQAQQRPLHSVVRHFFTSFLVPNYPGLSQFSKQDFCCPEARNWQRQLSLLHFSWDLGTVAREKCFLVSMSVFEG